MFSAKESLPSRVDPRYLKLVTTSTESPFIDTGVNWSVTLCATTNYFVFETFISKKLSLHQFFKIPMSQKYSAKESSSSNRPTSAMSSANLNRQLIAELHLM